MSRNRKNNHYHYAEKFSDASRRRAKMTAILMPRRAVFFAVLVLLAFGLISTTFSIDSSSVSSTDKSGGSIMVSVRGAKADHDVALTGEKVELVGTAGQYNMHWQGHVFFVAPASWDLATYSHVQLDVTRSTSVTTSTYQVYSNDMTRLGTSRVYYYNMDWDHNGWNQNEYLAFTANSSTYGTGTFNVNGNHYYTTPIDYGCNNSSNFYYFIATGTGNNATISTSSFKSSASALTAELSNTQTVQLRVSADGGSTYSNASASPGTVQFTTSFIHENGTSGGSNTVEATTSYTYSRSLKTTVNSLTATADTGYTFKGYRYNSTTATRDSTDPYTYTNTEAATIYADFDANWYTISYNLNGGSWATNYTVPDGRYYTTTATLPTAANISKVGYTFGGWYENSNLSGNAVTTVSATATDKTYYAKWVEKTYPVTYAKGDGSPVTGTIGGSVSNGTKRHFVDYTIKSNTSANTYTRAGFTQEGWATTKNATSVEYAFGGTYHADSTTDDDQSLTLYPVWSLNAPTASLSGGTIIAGSTLDLTPTVSGVPADATQSFTYSITGPSGNDAAITASNGTAATTSSMIFTTTDPGTYTVNITVTNTASTGVTGGNTASVTSDDVTIYVNPIAPVFTFVINGVANPTSDGDDNDPFLITLGHYYDFTGTVSNAQSGYNYEWSYSSEFTTLIGTSTVSGSSSAITFNDSSDSTPDVSGVTPGYQQTHAEQETNKITRTLYCRSSCNGRYNAALGIVRVYFIQPLVKNFRFVPSQKIYNVNTAVSLKANYSMDNAEGYTTELKFAYDNRSFVNTAPATEDEFLTVFDDVIQNFFYPSGPKFFYMHIYNDDVESDSSTLHTTVGTRSLAATKPLYFYNKTSLQLNAYQVMCYWLESGATGNAYGYQLAQDIDSLNPGFKYRVTIPANASKVQFALVRKDANQSYHYYGVPTLSNGAFTFAVPQFAGSTNLVTLTANTRVVETGSTYTVTSETVSGTSYDKYSFTCSSSAYKTN